MRKTMLAAMLALGTFTVAAEPRQAGEPLQNPGRTFLIIIDDLHMAFRSTPRSRELLKQMGRAMLRDGDAFAIVSTGHSTIDQPLTADREALEVALGRVTGGGRRPMDILNNRMRDAAESQSRARRAMSIAWRALKMLEPVNGQKSIIYVSEGYVMSGSDLSLEIRELARAANRMNAPIYAIDPGGLAANADLQGVDPIGWEQHLRATRDSLRVLVEGTGGGTVLNREAWDEFIRQRAR